MVSKNSSGFAIVVFISTLLFCKWLPVFTCFFVFKNKAVQHCSNLKWWHRLIGPLCSNPFSLSECKVFTFNLLANL